MSQARYQGGQVKWARLFMVGEQIELGTLFWLAAGQEIGQTQRGFTGRLLVRRNRNFNHGCAMNTTRRGFLKAAACGGLALTGIKAGARAPNPGPSFAKPARMHLGTVTYNLAKDWDIPTIIRNCEATRFEGVELHTTHAQGVEVTLTKAERTAVKKRFADSQVELMGLGSAFDFHTPDPAKLRHDIAATKDYIVLAHDVGAPGVKVRPNGLPRGVPREKTPGDALLSGSLAGVSKPAVK